MSFEADGVDTRGDRRDLHSLIEKLQSRFKVMVAIDEAALGKGECTLVLTTLAPSHEELHHRLDAIGNFCEGSTLGRIIDECAVVDEVDAMIQEDDPNLVSE
jgi:hypothetical protein